MQKPNHFARISISIYFFLLGFVFSSWASRIPDVKDQFDLSEAELGSLLFMLPLGALACLPLSGWLITKAGSKIVSISSMVLYSLTLLAIPYSKTTFHLSTALFLFGMLGNLGNISLNAQGISIQSRIGKSILSSLHAMWGVGAFSAAAVTDWMMENDIDTSYHYRIVSQIALFILILLFAFLVKDPPLKNEEQKIVAWPTRGLLMLGLICFCVAMSEGTMADWSSLYYRQVIHQPHVVSALGYTAFALFMTIGRFLSDPLVEQFGHGNVLKANGLLIAIGIPVALSTSIPAIVLVGFALVGLGVSSVFPIVYILATKEKSMVPSAALAAVSSVGFIGFLVGPPIIGWIAEAIGLRMALLLVVILGTTIFILAKRESKRFS